MSATGSWLRAAACRRRSGFGGPRRRSRPAGEAARRLDRLSRVTPATPGYRYYFNKGRDYGSDAYAGPLDNIFNKGFAVAQWQGKDRHIFSFPYGWTRYGPRSPIPDTR